MKKITGGALYRKIQMYMRLNRLATAILFIFGFLIIGAIFDSVTVGLALATFIPIGIDDDLNKHGVSLFGKPGGGRGKGDPEPDAPEVILAKALNEFNVTKKELQDGQKKLEDLLKDSPDAEKVKTLETGIVDMRTKFSKQLEDLMQIALKQGSEITHLKDSGSRTVDTDLFTLQRKEIKEKLPLLKTLRDGGEIDTEINGKKVKGREMLLEKTLVQRSAITSNTQSLSLTDIGQLATRKLTMYDIFPKITISESNYNGTITYRDWDAATMARAAAAIAEGAIFPASTAKWIQYQLTIKKIGVYITVTDEMLEDEQQFADELNLFLSTDVALERDRELCLGDGTSNTVLGINSSVPTYTATSASIQAPNTYDLITKMAESIMSTGGSKYNVDFALMNITDINNMKLKKDRNDNYLIYPGMSQDGTQLGPIMIIECNILTAGTLIVGDRRFAKIYEKRALKVEKGQINDQFIYDEYSLKASWRGAFLIRTVDQTGFLKSVDIAGDTLILA